MDNVTLLPADAYIVINKTVLTNTDRELFIDLYQPIIGSLATSLYFTFWSDLDKLEIMSAQYNHHHLMALLNTKLEDIKKARESLESFGLLKTYVNTDSVNHYIYELYSPISSNEFFNHPIFNVILYNNLGKQEYEMIKTKYLKRKFDYTNYLDITKNINDVYKSVSEISVSDNIIEKSTINGNALDLIDFDYVISSLPKELINEKLFNKRIKDLINNLAFLYNLDNLKIVELIRMTIEESNNLDKETLRKNARKYYQYNNNGSLPTLIYRTQPEHLRSPDGDTSKKGKILYVFENTSPYDFLKSKYKDGNPTSRDVKLIENLIMDLKLTPGVVNVLIDYVLKINNNKLNSAYVETIAGQWKRSNIETASEAMEFAEKEHKKRMKKTKEVKVKESSVPSWFSKEQIKEEASESEKRELDDLLKEFK